MFDYEKMADEILDGFLMQKKAGPQEDLLNKFFTDKRFRSTIEDALQKNKPGVFRRWAGLPLALAGMGLYSGVTKAINKSINEQKLEDSRDLFFETNPHLMDNPDAREIHDFVVRSSPDYGKAPRQLGKMVKNILDVDHYITPSVFETKQKKPDGFINSDSLAAYKALMAE